MTRAGKYGTHREPREARAAGRDDAAGIAVRPGRALEPLAQVGELARSVRSRPPSRPPTSSRQASASPATGLNNLHRQRHVAETLARFGKLADAGPGHVENHQRDALRRQHVEQLDPELRALLRIGVERDFDPRPFEKHHVMGHITDVADRLAAGGDHIDSVADRVSRRVHCLHSREYLLAVLDEHDAIAIGRQVLARRQGGAFRRRAETLVVHPEIEIGLGHVDLGVRKVTAAVVRDHPAGMVDMRVRQHDRIDVLGVDIRLLEAREQPAGLRTGPLTEAMPVSNRTS